MEYVNAKVFHPQPDDHGRAVRLYCPSAPAGIEHLASPTQLVTFVPAQPLSGALNGVAFAAWQDLPATPTAWNTLAPRDLLEPKFDLPAGKVAAAGAVIIEPDGRLWIVAPSNEFAGYRATFPKGRQDPDLSLPATAIKECYEESGLKIALVAFLGDFSRSQTHTRFYLARRIGGSPVDMGWESQAVHLVPPRQALSLLNRSADHAVARQAQCTLAQLPDLRQALCFPNTVFCVDDAP